jgi:hypothetical protein
VFTRLGGQQDLAVRRELAGDEYPGQAHAIPTPSVATRASSAISSASIT